MRLFFENLIKSFTSNTGKNTLNTLRPFKSYDVTDRRTFITDRFIILFFWRRDVKNKKFCQLSDF